ncbi:tol-pal system protein YbgF [Vibrio sp. RC27]
MFGNTQFRSTPRVAMLTLLACAANSAFAAPAPVSDLNGNSTILPSVSGTSSNKSRVERLIESRNQMQLQMQQQLEQMTMELQELRGIVERNSYDIEQTIQRQRELFIEVDSIRTQAKNTPSAASGSESTASTEGTYSENVDEQAAYQNAVDLILKKRDYSGAIDAFNQFRQQFPNSSFTPNAHYWLGQLYFAKKQYNDAQTNFASVVNFESSSKRADALVKLGDIEKQNNNSAAATRYYQQVVSEYPSSKSADEAKQKLGN